MNDLLSEKEAAKILGISPATLRVNRCAGQRYRNGIPFIPFLKIGKNVRYERNKIEEILTLAAVDCAGGNNVASTTEYCSSDSLPKDVADIKKLQGVALVSPEFYSPGVYFLCVADRVVYVGQSSNPCGRISQHIQSGKQFDSAYVLPVALENLDNVETHFILLFAPSLNGRRVNGRLVTPSVDHTPPLNRLYQECPDLIAPKQTYFSLLAPPD